MARRGCIATFRTLYTIDYDVEPSVITQTIALTLREKQV